MPRLAMATTAGRPPQGERRYWLNSCVSLRLRCFSKKAFRAGNEGISRLATSRREWPAERMAIGRIELRVNSGRVDGRHHGEKPWGCIELAQFLGPARRRRRLPKHSVRNSRQYFSLS